MNPSRVLVVYLTRPDHAQRADQAVSARTAMQPVVRVTTCCRGTSDIDCFDYHQSRVPYRKFAIELRT